MTAMAYPDRAPGSRGFTLIELLASLLAGSLLLLWLGWAVAGIGEQWTKSSRTDPARELAANRLRIAELIEGALFPLPADGLAAATDDRLAFVVVPPRAVKGTTLARLDLAVEPGAGGTRRLAARLYDLRSGQALTPPSELAGGWKVIRFTSEAPAREGARPLVEIGFVSMDGERFAILARPKINVKPGCKFDPISLECRP